MFLTPLLKTSDNQYLHHFEFDRKGDKFTFFTNENKDVLSCEKSVPEALVEYFQSRQLFPPYLSWELGDMISEHQDEQGYAFISDNILDANIDTNQDMLIQLLNLIDYRVVTTGTNQYHIFDSEDNSIGSVFNFYQGLAFFLNKINAIDDEMLEQLTQ